LLGPNPRGSLKSFVAKVNSLVAKAGPFHLILCLGSPFPTGSHGNDQELQEFLDSKHNCKFQQPVMFISADSLLPLKVREVLDRNTSGEITTELYFMGASSLNT
jgi:hypothetical protein